MKIKINYDLLYGLGLLNLMAWGGAFLDMIYRMVTGNMEPSSGFIYLLYAILPFDAAISIVLGIVCGILAISGDSQKKLIEPIKRALIVWGINLASIFIVFVILPIIGILIEAVR